METFYREEKKENRIRKENQDVKQETKCERDARDAMTIHRKRITKDTMPET